MKPGGQVSHMDRRPASRSDRSGGGISRPNGARMRKPQANIRPRKPGFEGRIGRFDGRRVYPFCSHHLQTCYLSVPASCRFSHKHISRRNLDPILASSRRITEFGGCRCPAGEAPTIESGLFRTCFPAPAARMLPRGTTGPVGGRFRPGRGARAAGDAGGENFPVHAIFRRSPGGRP